MRAKIIQCNVPASDLPKVRAFYAKLLGTDDFARSLNDKVVAYHRTISHDGLMLTLTARQHGQEPIVCYFAVDNIDQTLRDLQAAGGRIVYGPVDLPTAPAVVEEYKANVRQSRAADNPTGDIGRSALVRDPEGNVVGITQLRPESHKHFKYGRHAVGLDADQIAQHERAVALGRKLGGGH
jgi:predicted enzyme related to lactoylglutathione lyase